MKREPPPTPRPLTSEELALLNWLLEHGLPEARTFAPQVEKIRATSWCDCGCPSIFLHVDEGLPLGTSSNTLISEFSGKTADARKLAHFYFRKTES
jgi:hypothetical protein